MKKYATYLLIYSILGFLLERFINLIFLGTPYDNSVLIGPYQPLYGAGITALIFLYDAFIRNIKNVPFRYALLILFGIITTGLSELFSGLSYEWLTGLTLWDYGQTFTCSYPYVCALPTSLFGLLSALTVRWIHPFIEKQIKQLPKKLINVLLVLFLVDYVYTILKLILSV